MPEPFSRPGLLAALTPMVAVARPCAAHFSHRHRGKHRSWSSCFYLSLVPSLVTATTGSTAPLTAGKWSQRCRSALRLPPIHCGRADSATAACFGPTALAAGIALIAGGVHAAGLPVNRRTALGPLDPELPRFSLSAIAARLLTQAFDFADRHFRKEPVASVRRLVALRIDRREIGSCLA
jgi:hypothetical protein